MYGVDKNGYNSVENGFKPILFCLFRQLRFQPSDDR